MNDTIEGAKITGLITLDGENIYDQRIDVVELRARVGMVFKSLVLFQNLYLKMLLMVRAFMVW